MLRLNGTPGCGSDDNRPELDQDTTARGVTKQAHAAYIGVNDALGAKEEHLW
jgi:hypothetical protein